MKADLPIYSLKCQQPELDVNPHLQEVLTTEQHAEHKSNPHLQKEIMRVHLKRLFYGKKKKKTQLITAWVGRIIRKVSGSLCPPEAAKQNWEHQTVHKYVHVHDSAWLQGGLARFKVLMLAFWMLQNRVLESEVRMVGWEGGVLSCWWKNCIHRRREHHTDTCQIKSYNWSSAFLDSLLVQ